jgi:hypothetical protein
MHTHKHVQGIPWDHKEGQIGDDVETVNGEAVVTGKKYQFPEAGWTRVSLCSYSVNGLIAFCLHVYVFFP